jgi:hypothetical protein
VRRRMVVVMMVRIRGGGWCIIWGG